MSFHVGQKVCCVDDSERVSWRPKGWFERLRSFRRISHNLNRGDIYTITSIDGLKDNRTQQIVEALFLDGAWHFGHRDVGFPSFQFRPLVERKTDISALTALLVPGSKIRETA